MKKILQSKFFRLVASVSIAYLLYVICPACLSKSALLTVLITLLVIINLFPYANTAKGALHTVFYWLVQIMRIAVGGLFIFSGWIKANDTIGFGYKLEEYFEVFKEASDWGIFESMAHIAQPLATVICVSEMLLGFLLLIGLYRNISLWLLMLQIVFFTFLTFYSACYNKVTTCGCFGDFLVLTPWTSFWKDIALLIAIAVLFVGKEHINPLFNQQFLNMGLLLAFTVFSVWFPIHTFRNLPVKDFRAYAPGLSICEGMKKGPNYKPGVYEVKFVYSNLKTGEDKEFSDKDIPWQDTLNWKYKDRMVNTISPEIDAPKILDFSINDLDGNPITDSILGLKGYYFLLVCYDLNKTAGDEELHAKMNDFYTLCEKDKIPVLALTASGAEKINEFKHKHNALYDFANMDGIVLKTMIRSNPGLMLMKDCRVVANWHHNNWPVYSDIKAKLMK